MSSATTTALGAALALLMVDSITEMSLVSDMVSWLHRTAGGQFTINNPTGGQFTLHGKPLYLLVNQGHTSNAAGGTAFIAVGLGGILALLLRQRQLRRGTELHGFTSFFYHFWVYFNIPAVMLYLTALVFTFVLTYQHMHQSININVASQLHNKPYPNMVPYPDLAWTPENWFQAVLRLPLADGSVRNDIHLHYELMKAWRWNLIPMTILGIVVMILALMDMKAVKRRMGKGSSQRHLEAFSRQKMGAPYPG